MAGSHRTRAENSTEGARDTQWTSEHPESRCTGRTRARRAAITPSSEPFFLSLVRQRGEAACGSSGTAARGPDNAGRPLIPGLCCWLRSFSSLFQTSPFFLFFFFLVFLFFLFRSLHFWVRSHGRARAGAGHTRSTTWRHGPSAPGAPPPASWSPSWLARVRARARVCVCVASRPQSRTQNEKKKEKEKEQTENKQREQWWRGRVSCRMGRPAL